MCVRRISPWNDRLAVVALACFLASGVEAAQPPSASFAFSQFLVTERAGAAFIYVVLTRDENDPAAAFSVQFSTMEGEEGTALAGVDYERVTGVVEWLPEESGPKTFRVPIIDDDEQEEDETVLLVLFSPVGGELGEITMAELIIVDEEPEPEPSAVTPEGETSLTGRVGTDLTLAVLVTDEDDEPIDGFPVSWEVTGGGARFPADSMSAVEETGDDGVAEITVTLPIIPGESTVTAEVEGLEPVSFTLTAELITDLSGLDETETPVATALNEICRRGDLSAALRQLCDDVGLLPAGDLGAAMRAVAPEEVAAQGTVSLASQATQFRNIEARLEVLRGGATRAAMSDLAFRVGDVTLGGDPGPAPAAEPIDVAAALDARQSDEPTGEADDGEADDDEAAEPGSSRLGFFVTGTIGAGDRPEVSREPGFDLETEGITAGVDYRLNDQLIVGGALGFSAYDVELAGGGGELEVEGYSLSAYGAFSMGNFYLDGILTYGDNAFEVSRAIDFPGRSRLLARGEPDGSQIAVSLGSGYELQQGAATLGGFARVELVDAAIDRYREQGAPGFDLEIDEQEVQSLLTKLGLQLTYAATLGRGVLLSTFKIAYLHELEDGSRDIVSRFVDDPGGTSFAIPTAAPDRDYFNVGFGLSALLARGHQAFVFYQSDLDRDDLNNYLVSAGLHFKF